jgi:hypothetical protein
MNKLIIVIALFLSVQAGRTVEYLQTLDQRQELTELRAQNVEINKIAHKLEALPVKAQNKPSNY